MKIAVLLSTYHPNAEFLKQQLVSIEKQTLPVTLIRRDDSETHLGAMRSFETLLRETDGFDYYAFADQDDVWKPEKMEVLVAAMEKAEEEFGKQTPIVVHSDLQVVDCRLQPIAESFWEYGGLNPDLLDGNIHFLTISNSVTGCAMLLNQAAREAGLPFGSQAYMHDQWIAQQTLLKGGRVIPIRLPLVLYRQHGNNTLGAVEYNGFTLSNFGLKKKLFRQAYRAGKGICWNNLLQFLYWKTRHILARL